MGNEKLKEHIENILKLTAIRLKDVYDNHKEMDGCFKESMFNSRLVFPKYRDDKTRISEQELRFCFVEVFNEYCNLKELPLYYSVETPTSGIYNFKGKTPKQQSGNIDLVIYNDKLKRVCLIEFKACNAEKSEHEKDLLKLNNEEKGNEDLLRYFVETVKSYNNGTLSSLKNKISTKGDDTLFRCYALESKESESYEDITEKIYKAKLK